SMERANDVLLVAGKDFTQASVERRGMSGIKKLWESSSAHRKFLGKQVDEGLKAVEKKTGGKAVFNLDAAAKDALDELPDFSRMTDEEFALLKKVDPSVEKLRNVLDSINTNPNKTATQAIEMRRLLDDLTDWTTSTSQIPANIPSQRAMRKLAKGIREETSRWAAATGDTKLLKANKRFASHAKTHEALLEFVPLRSDTELAALNSFEKAKLAFNKGGSRHEILADIVDDIPGGEDALNEVFDAAAAFPFTQLPKGTPSGAAKDMIRLLASPKNARAGILAAHNVRNLLRATAQAGASGLG
ncbi:MAG: hypothetical protein GTN65_05415, partial [Armatimonadetes bacterium]|nr:hypothetical protein [Armatimonadota bacterium]NIO96532.1 hypothetical protein [Armatimonadota bacterium]